MEIKNLIVGNDYRTDDLKQIFKNKSFMRGINICKRTHAIVLVSKKAENKGREYEDTWDNEKLNYTGEGQRGDQLMRVGNKAIRDAEKEGNTLYLFVKDKHRILTYYGIVDLIIAPYQINEKDVDGNSRLVYKFPIRRRVKGLRPLTPEEMNSHRPGGLGGVLKTYYVVGAAIFNDKGQLLCAQRQSKGFEGKWEFAGGKIEQGESPEQAVEREIMEEMKIKVIAEEEIASTSHTYKDRIINLRIFKCRYVEGDISDFEHSAVKWCAKEEASSLDWADADQEVFDDVTDYFPAKLDVTPEQFDYFEIKPEVDASSKESRSQRAVQNYEVAERRKKRHGNQAEEALLQYEKDELLENGRPDLADKVERVSKRSSDIGFDILSFERTAKGTTVEKHIEVKYVDKTSGYITFFISAAELELFKNDQYYQIYCLYRVGMNYKYHIVNKSYWKDEYLKPLTYQVRIKISE